MHDRLVPYLPRLFGYAVNLCLNGEAARDLVQDCALRALQARRVPADEPAFRAWLFVILRNLFLDQQRGRSVAAAEADNAQAAAAQAAWGHDDSLINTLTVKMGMERLSRDHREVIALVDIAGFSYTEAACLLDVPSGTVMSRLSRARRALLDQMMASNVHVLPEMPRKGAK
jgi:RNA polymerase sigma-70 factor, ECF subfamily